MTFKIEFPGSMTTANRPREASFVLRSTGQKVQVGFKKSKHSTTKIKYLDVEDLEVFMNALMDHQAELAEMIATAKQAVADGATIKDGEIVTPASPEPKPEPKPAPTPKRFSLSTVEASAETVAEAPARIVPPAPPKPTKSVATVATTPSPSASAERAAKLAKFRAAMGR